MSTGDKPAAAAAPAEPPQPRIPYLSHIWALLRQRCPRCHRGRMFRNRTIMNDPCPACGLVYEREPGYFLGAMYFSYALSIAVTAPLFYLGVWLFPTWNQSLVALGVLVVYLPMVPMVFRYSRVLWVYYDRALFPTDFSSHEGWMKWREAGDREKNENLPKN